MKGKRSHGGRFRKDPAKRVAIAKGKIRVNEAVMHAIRKER
jgi:hypothetical protein